MNRASCTATRRTVVGALALLPSARFVALAIVASLSLALIGPMPMDLPAAAGADQAIDEVRIDGAVRFRESIGFRTTRPLVRSTFSDDAYTADDFGVPHSVGEVALADEGTRTARRERIEGTWRSLPESPFGAALGSGVWAGDQMIVTTYGRKRIAGYDPRTKRWTRYPGAPYVLQGFGPLTWTGQEVLVQTIEIGPDDERQVLLAFDPAARTWRQLTPPFERFAHFIWADDRLIAASGAQAATYDPVRDAWAALPDVPGAAGVIGLDWTGEHVLASVVSAPGRESQDTRIDVAVLDPDTRSWTLAAPSPVALLWPDPGHVWTGSELVLFTDKKNNERRTFHAAYDPRADTWRTIDAACRVPARGAVWTGRLIVNGTKLAYDPATGRCLRLPDRDDRTRNDPVRVWTGREVIEWSGARGDDMTPIPDGIRLRLARAYRGPTATPADPATSVPAAVACQQAADAFDGSVVGAFDTSVGEIRKLAHFDTSSELRRYTGSRAAALCYVDGQFAKSPPPRPDGTVSPSFDRAGLVVVDGGPTILVTLGYRDTMRIQLPDQTRTAEATAES